MIEEETSKTIIRILMKSKRMSLQRGENMLMEINGEMYDLIDDSKMPSAEESKKFVISDELREKMRKSDDELAHELGYY